MKKFSALALGMLSALPLLAANTVNYQAVINNAAGQPAADTEIGLSFTIKDGENKLYSEETVVKSNAKGLVEYAIGSADEDAFAALDWAANLTLEVGIDLAGGTDYSSVYSSTIQAVPNALYSTNGALALDQAEFNAGEIDRNRMLISGLQSEMAEVKENADVNYDDLKGQIDRNGGLINALQSEMATAQDYEEFLHGEIERNAVNISVLQSAVATLDPENTADALEQALANAGAIERANGLITELQNQMSEANENYDIMAGDIERVEGKVTGLQNEMGQVNENYDLLVGDIERVSGNISQLQSEMATATDMIEVNTGAIERNAADISQLQSHMATSQDDYDALVGSVNRNDNRIVSLQNELAETNDMVDQNTGKIERNDLLISQLQSQTAQLEANMTDLPNAYAEKLNDLRNDVNSDYDNLSGYVDRNTALITELQNQIEALKAEIEALKKAAE